MSVPYKIITCSSCGRGAWSAILFGHFVWRDDSHHEYPIDRELGYCRSCEQIVAKEILPTASEVNAARDARDANSIKRQSNATWLDRIPLLRNLIAEDRGSSSDFEVLEAVMDLGRAPVCLQCGSDQVITIPRPETGDGTGQSLTRTGVMHPGCGGEFLIKDSGGDRIAFRLVKRVYDINGRLIETKPYSR